MDVEIMDVLQGGNKTMAWLGAVAIAAGGTALVVAIYIQIQRLKPGWTGLGAHARRLWRDLSAPLPRPRPRTRSDAAPPAVQPRPDAAGLAAYRAVQTAVPVPPDRLETESAGLESLDLLLRRLRRAAESLEEIALKSGRLSGAGVGYDAFATGMDVEYLHRQN